MDRDLRHELQTLAGEYGLLALYVFGSRAEEIAGRVVGSPAGTVNPDSDVDIGVQPLRTRLLTAEDRVHTVHRLETLLGADRVDLVILPEANSFLAADVVRGELLLATDLDAEAELQLYYLRQAADLAPLLRERWRETVGRGS
jgi:predicted nucleotidyltransferase